MGAAPLASMSLDSIRPRQPELFGNRANFNSNSKGWFMQTNHLQRVSTNTQEDASGVIRVWQRGKQFINELVQRAATGINNRLLTAMTVAALMMIPSYPARAQNSFINLVNSVSEKCLQPINNSTTPGDAIVLLPCDPKNTAQVWIQTASSGKVHFINYNSKLCLDARGGAAAGTPIQQWTCNSITNENWWNPRNTSGPLISAVSGTSNFCLIPTGSQDGADLQLIPCSTSVYHGELFSRPAVPDPNPPPNCVPSKFHPCP
jgi:hypothetical protein